MPILLDDSALFFPDHSEADEHGILAVGGDLSPARLLMAYYEGIFPWPHPGFPLLWFSPDPRFVLEPKNIIINRSLSKALKNSSLSIAADRDFTAVMRACQTSSRQEQQGTWITDEMIDSYSTLHHMGFAHSIEAYDQNELVGGLYGIGIGSMFFGESMFFLAPNASKIAFITLVAQLIEWNFTLIDCQSHTEHLARFGAHPIARKDFLQRIYDSHRTPTRQGKWQLEVTPKQALSIINLRHP